MFRKFQEKARVDFNRSFRSRYQRHEFALPHGIIKVYQGALDNPLPEEPEKEELSEYWQVFRDFSSMKRPKVALQVFCQSRGNIFQKIRDCLYILYVPVETVVSA